MKMAVRRGSIVALGIILQICLSLSVYLFLGKYIKIIGIFYSVLSILIVLWMIKESKRLSATIPWIIIIMIFPLVGSLLFIIIGRNIHRSKRLKSINKEIEDSWKYLKQDSKVKKEIEKYGYTDLKYISDFAKFPVTKNNKVDYYSIGDDAFPVMLEELKKAKKFIFIEYFIINQGIMWNSILEILKDKAQNGVDVRVIYDDMGSLAMLPSNYPKHLESFGIKCIAFNELKPFAGVIMNNRDHRKMTIIDGHTAFSGGINISDEYINLVHPHGHWKDNVIRIKGEAVWNFTVMFLSIWNSYRKDDLDYKKFKYQFKTLSKEKGYVAPYGESPLDDEVVGEDVYLNMINEAKKYVYIYTPYLIIDTDMINALTRSAKKGVDVRLVVPGIPDKKVVYSLTKSYFETLIKGGVKIYQYTEGFVHSKVFISDNVVATVGTINLDYRSLYLHFECGVLMREVKAIKDIYKDITQAMEKSHQVTKEEVHSKFFKNLWQAILRLFAPLM